MKSQSWRFDQFQVLDSCHFALIDVYLDMRSDTNSHDKDLKVKTNSISKFYLLFLLNLKNRVLVNFWY